MVPLAQVALLLRERHGHLRLFARVKKDGKVVALANTAQLGLVGFVALAPCEAHEHVLSRHANQELLKALGLLGNGESRQQAVLAVVISKAVVASARQKVLHVLLVRCFAHHQRSQLGIRRGIHRQHVGVLLLEHRGVAVHLNAVVEQELVQLLALGLDHVRLVNDDERILDVQRGLEKVLVEKDLDKALLVKVRVKGQRVIDSLLLKLGLGRATQDICVRDILRIEHALYEALEGARLTRLAKGAQKGVAHAGIKRRKDARRRLRLICMEHDGGSKDLSIHMCPFRIPRRAHQFFPGHGHRKKLICKQVLDANIAHKHIHTFQHFRCKPSFLQHVFFLQAHPPVPQ